MSSAGPLGTGGHTVPADWIDYNGHMMDGYYAIAFTEATDALLDHLGLWARPTGRRPAPASTPWRATCASPPASGPARRWGYSSQLLGADAKRLHFSTG